jgi:hypothetical protein
LLIFYFFQSLMCIGCVKMLWEAPQRQSKRESTQSLAFSLFVCSKSSTFSKKNPIFILKILCLYRIKFHKIKLGIWRKFCRKLAYIIKNLQNLKYS